MGFGFAAGGLAQGLRDLNADLQQERSRQQQFEFNRATLEIQQDFANAQAEANREFQAVENNKNREINRQRVQNETARLAQQKAASDRELAIREQAAAANLRLNDFKFKTAEADFAFKTATQKFQADMIKNSGALQLVNQRLAENAAMLARVSKPALDGTVNQEMINTLTAQRRELEKQQNALVLESSSIQRAVSDEARRIQQTEQDVEAGVREAPEVGPVTGDAAPSFDESQQRLVEH